MIIIIMDIYIVPLSAKYNAYGTGPFTSSFLEPSHLISLRIVEPMLPII